MPRILSVSQLNKDGLVHGFSTLELGNVGMTHAPDPTAVTRSRRAFANALDLTLESLVVAGAVHGAQVARVHHPTDVINNVDALITDQPQIGLFATFADCYPIVLWDATHRAAGLVHAGWRGTAAGVARAAIRAMTAEFSSRPEDIRAGIGPGICGKCYEVGEEVATQFDPRFTSGVRRGKFMLDLAAANRAQMEDLGVREIFDINLCTKESDFLPSHRRNADGTRFGAIVAIR
jgi:polyphenol oxidase